MTQPCVAEWRDDIGHPGGGVHSCIRRHLTTDAEPATFHLCVCGSDIHEVPVGDFVLLPLVPPVNYLSADVLLGRIFGDDLKALVAAAALLPDLENAS